MIYVVFDCEANGMHGETFSVGYVVVEEDGREIESGSASCPIMMTGVPDQWVVENVIPVMGLATHPRPEDVRAWFWPRWQYYKKQGAELWADCHWPVETNFLSACVADDPVENSWLGPYPFHEIGTVLKLAGLDPRGTYPRLDNELPAHNALCDARQSARLLTKSLKFIKEAMGTGEFFNRFLV